MKLLIAAACVVIIASGGWYGWSEWQDAKAEAAAAALRQDEAERLEWVKAEQSKRECETYIAAWDKGPRSLVREKFGDFAEDIVDNCRYMLPIYDLKLQSDPS